MTTEEAVKYLIRPTVTSTEVSEEKQKEIDAYNMAIEALLAMKNIERITQEMKAILHMDGKESTDADSD